MVFTLYVDMLLRLQQQGLQALEHLLQNPSLSEQKLVQASVSCDLLPILHERRSFVNDRDMSTGHLASQDMVESLNPGEDK